MVDDDDNDRADNRTEGHPQAIVLCILLPSFGSASRRPVWIDFSRPSVVQSLASSSVQLRASGLLSRG